MATDRIRSHGWVTPLPGGAVARCGGPGMCSHCQLEQQVAELRFALATVATNGANAAEAMSRRAGDAERAEREADDAHRALALLLAGVNLLTLADPTHYEIANAIGGPALAARQVLDRAGRLEWVHEAVQRLKGA